jgi:2,4-dienoyl-CoA reductase-like NADH-dependent reductase (Old Yellow Enzyme family)
MSRPLLFSPFRLRGVVSPNRCVLSPMVQYKATNGEVNDYHLVHLGQFALGCFGIVFTENCAVEPRGRVTQGDLGIWGDCLIDGHKRLVQFIQQQGSLAGIQISHAGRKGSSRRPFDTPGQFGPASAHWRPWDVVGPSPIPAAEGLLVPKELTIPEIEQLVQSFATAARRAIDAGYDVIELHAAHGYLLAQFLSPISNLRQDHYGGDLAGRMRFPLEVVQAMRRVIPNRNPLFVRVSALDGAGGWDLGHTVAFSKELKALGVDVVDCSSGGLAGYATAQTTLRRPGFQVPFALEVRGKVGIATMAVGLILDGHQAEAILQASNADLIAIGREALNDPHWPLHAARALGFDQKFEHWPSEYGWWLNNRQAHLVDEFQA